MSAFIIQDDGKRAAGCLLQEVRTLLPSCCRWRLLEVAAGWAGTPEHPWAPCLVKVSLREESSLEGSLGWSPAVGHVAQTEVPAELRTSSCLSWSVGWSGRDPGRALALAAPVKVQQAQSLQP